jgi:hypothetical protein
MDAGKRMFTDKIKKTILDAARALTGYKKRAYIAQVSNDYFQGNTRRTEREMGWGRETIETGINEIKSGIRCLDYYSGRGNKRTEDKLAGLEDAIQAIVQPHTQTDPDFRNSYSYLKITAKSVRAELLNNGYEDNQLPTERTISNILNRMNYSLKRVQKKTS